MKKILSILSIAVLLLTACTDKEHKVILSGKITNPVADSVKIFYADEPIATFKVDSDGTFADTLELKKDFYILGNGNRFIPFYAVPGKINLTFNTQDLPASAIFKGDGEKENNFLSALRGYKIKRRFINSYTFWGQLPEKKFLQFADSLYKATINFIDNNYKGNDKFFISYLKKEAELDKWQKIKDYPRVRAYILNKEDYKVSDDYPEAFKKVDMNDENMVSSYTYMMFLRDYFLDKIPDSSKTMYIDLMDSINKGIKNKTIRERLIYLTTKDNITETKDLPTFYKKFNEYVTNPKFRQKIKNIYKKLERIMPGQPSPVFTFADSTGTQHSLNEYKGKLVYIDIWAIWCSPCVKEIPYLEQLKNDFKDKPIVFISINVGDNEKKWKNFIAQNKMTDVQLHAESWAYSFFDIYMIKWIPRFILIDENGNIIDNNAPRPSNPELKTLLSNHLPNENN